MTDVVSTGSTDVSAVRYERDDDGIVTLTLDDPTSSANTMNELYKDSMAAAVDRLYAEVADDPQSVTGVVVASAKKTFFAGGNLKAMVQATKADAPAIFEMGEGIKASLRRLETFPRPVAAAINGAALGGGYEITLACNHRVVVDDPKAEVGLPEASLGLLPGGGGVTRVTRMLGIQSALMDVLLQGTRFKPGTALEKGLVDEVVATREELVPAAKAWIKANPDSWQNPWDAEGYKMPGGTPSHPKLAAFLPAFPALLRKQTKGAVYPAQRAILSASVEGAQVDFDTASRIESRYLTKLIVDQNSKNMIQAFFFDLQAINAGKLRPEGIPPYQAVKVGVLGAGMMGAGIAYSCARAGMEVVLKDVAVENAEKGKAYSEKLLDKAISRGRSTEEKKAELLGRITPTADAADLAGCDLVIEAVFEDPVSEEQGVRGDPRARQRRRSPLLQHLDPADHRARGGRRPAEGLHRPALLQPGRQDAAGRDHPWRGDLRRGPGQGLRRRPADPEDPDRRQRQPRLLHVARDRHDGQRGARHAGRGGAPRLARAGSHPGRLPGRHPPALRRAEHGADEEDPGGHPGGRRARRRHLQPAPLRAGDRHDDRPPAARRGSRAPASTSTTRTASGSASGRGWPTRSRSPPSRSRSRT